MSRIGLAWGTSSFVNDRQAWADARRFFSQLAAPLGVYLVSGSPPVDQEHAVSRILEGLPVRWLRDEKTTLKHGANLIDLVGVSCTHRPFSDGPKLEAALGEATRRFTVLLHHTPDLAPQAAKAGVDLQLSGHTHGGQVRLPLIGALYTSSLYGKKFEQGRRQVDGMTLYVTRGIGLEGRGAPRVRLLCRPEVTVWEISA